MSIKIYQYIASLMFDLHSAQTENETMVCDRSHVFYKWTAGKGFQMTKSLAVRLTNLVNRTNRSCPIYHMSSKKYEAIRDSETVSVSVGSLSRLSKHKVTGVRCFRQSIS